MANRQRQELVLDRKVFSFNHESDQDDTGYLSHPQCGKKQGEEPPCEVDQTKWIEQYKVGEEIVFHVSAPGAGHHTYRVTRIDEKGAWGIMLEDTSRMLEISDVI